MRTALEINDVVLTVNSVIEGMRPTLTGIGYEVSEVSFTPYLTSIAVALVRTISLVYCRQ
jgi:hypothetical protein